jgi:hypothetical protein
MTMTKAPWYTTPAALAIIVSLRRNPPRLAQHEKRYVLTVDRWSEYTGRRVDRLGEIAEAAWAQISTPFDEETCREFLTGGIARDVVNAVCGGAVAKPFLGAHCDNSPLYAQINANVDAALAADRIAA